VTFSIFGALGECEWSACISAAAVVNLFAAGYRALGFDGCSSHSGRRRIFVANAARRISTVGGSLRDVQLLAGHAALTTKWTTGGGTVRLGGQNLKGSSPKMSIAFALALVLVLPSCAARVTFLDRSNGIAHFGQTGSTAGSNGNITALIEDKEYRGTWIYSASGGSAFVGTSTGNAFATSRLGATTVNATSINSGVSMPTSGNGLINMRSDGGDFIRCVFNFSSSTMTGIGHCVRNDGREFDIAISR
jgi:hypothetical protein